MSIRIKIFACLAGVALATWAGMSYLASSIYLQRYDELDRQRLTRSVNQVREIMNAETAQTRRALAHWLGNNAFWEGELLEESAYSFLREFDLGVMVLIGERGEVERAFSPMGPIDTLSSSDAAKFAGMVALASSRGGAESALIETSRAPLMAVALGRSGSVVAGAPAGVVTGFFLDKAYELALRKTMLTDLQFLPASGDIMASLSGSAQQQSVWIPEPGEGAESLTAYSLLRDIDGRPLLILKLTDSRHSLLEATGNLRFYLGTTAAAAIGFVLFGALLVEFLVVSRIRRLTSSARRADINGMEDLPRRMTAGKDEVGILARVTKSMVEKLKAAQTLYRTVIETQTELILRYLPDGEITLANEAFAKFVGRHAKSVRGKNLKELLTPEMLDGRDILAELPSVRKRTVTSEFEVEIEGKRRWLSWNQKALVNSDREVTEIQAVGHDLTMQREYETSLVEARGAAEAADRSKGEFLSIMSHETRTPLTSIIGFASVLSSTELNDSQKEYVGLIQSSSETLLMLLNDVLDYSNVASGRIELRPTTVDVAAFARELVATHTPEARQKDLDLEVDLDPQAPSFIELDVGRARQIIHNLLQNGLKFTEHGFVRLSVAPGPDATTISFSVQDTGVGIPDEDQERIFDAFGMSDSSNSRGHGGAGIGLAVCRKLLTIMGGQISVRSAPGIGSLFTVIFPIGSPSPETLAKEQSKKIEEQKPKAGAFAQYQLTALVVDDNRINQMVIGKLLKVLGISTHTVSGGREAIQHLEDNKVDVVFMDIQMPDMDGFETTAQIRAKESDESTTNYIVACTAFDLPGDRERCLDSGMDDFLQKPVNSGQIQQAMERMLQRSGKLPSQEVAEIQS